jgi:hypothetical protein
MKFVSILVIPAKAGIQIKRTGYLLEFIPWTPAFAGVTNGAGMTVWGRVLILLDALNRK